MMATQHGLLVAKADDVRVKRWPQRWLLPLFYVAVAGYLVGWELGIRKVAGEGISEGGFICCKVCSIAMLILSVAIVLPNLQVLLIAADHTVNFLENEIHAQDAR